MFDSPETIYINDSIRLELAGENALMLYFSEPLSLTTKQESVISTAINNKVYQAVQLIRQRLAIEVIDVIPSYASLLVMFNLEKIDHYQLANKLTLLLKHYGTEVNTKSRVVEIPVYYSLESGIDLARIAKQAELSIEEVINLHQAPVYRVYAIGFAPGFAYLGEVDQRIATPRLTTPRLKVPKGAVAIADRQTAVYPAQSPGGWNIIGLSPVDMFTVQAQPPMLVEVGDSVKFIAIDKQHYLELAEQANFADKTKTTIEI